MIDVATLKSKTIKADYFVHNSLTGNRIQVIVHLDPLKVTYNVENPRHNKLFICDNIENAVKEYNDLEELYKNNIAATTDNKNIDLPKNNTLKDFEVGDLVSVHNTLGTNIPCYLEGFPLKVIGLGRKNVKCDWDGGKPFFIPPEMLRKENIGKK